MSKVFKPEVFQGSLRKRNYFEGWYFKHVSADNSKTFSFIPGISLSKDNPHAFIQIINGITGETDYLEYKKSDFKWRKNKLYINVGGSVFTDEYIDLNINQNNLSIQGRLTFNNVTKYPKSLVSPGIMGWYSYVPFMECKHGIVSANHEIDGVIQVNTKQFKFTGGKGYIEKDWGTSFPEAWLWIQANSFENRSASVFVSVAKIPWFRKFFTGFIVFFCVDNKFYRFATYNKSTIDKIERNGRELTIAIRNKNYLLSVNAIYNSDVDIKSPENGSMIRSLKESVDSVVHVKLTDRKNNILFEGESKRAGMEIIDEVFNYL